jgi:hypothetical protein
MNAAIFKASLSGAQPPAGLSIYLCALWYDGHGDWNRAHQLVQDLPDKTAARIHAYLHRREGDNGNAAYWYHKAGLSLPAQTLEKEWETIVQDLLV